MLVRLLAVVRSTALGRALCEVCAFCFARLKQLWEMTLRPSGHVVNSLVPVMSGNATVDPNCETLSDCGSIESGGDDGGSASGARGSDAAPALLRDFRFSSPTRGPPPAKAAGPQRDPT